MHRRRRTYAGWVLALACLLGLGSTAVAGESGPGPWRDALEGPLGAVRDADPEPAGPRIVTLREGVRTKLLSAEGFKPSSYRQVMLRVRNTTEEPLRVDVCGSHLVPKRRGSCQRLGIGPVVTPRKRPRPTKRHPRPPEQPPGTVIIGLEAGEERVVHLWTCCLDSGKPAPRAQSFTVSVDPLPAVRESALRWWADNPDAAQSVVNRAIWQFRPIDESSAFDFQRGGRRPRVLGGSGLALHAGTLYRLHAGELTSRDPDGIVRFLGTQMDGVYPTDSAIYAVSWGSHGGLQARAAPPPRELWRLVPTGDDPWALVARIGSHSIHAIHISPRGAILVRTHMGLFRVDHERKLLAAVLLTDDTDYLSVAFTKKGMARVTHRRPAGQGYVQGGDRKGETMPVCELWSVDPATGAKERLEEYWNVRQVLTGRAGTYALTHGGKLRRLAGRSFRTAPGQQEYDRIVHVGRQYVWLESKRGRLVAADKAGRLRFENGPRMPDRGSYAFDPHDDRLVWRKGSRWWSLAPSRGKREALDPDAEAAR